MVRVRSLRLLFGLWLTGWPVSGGGVCAAETPPLLRFVHLTDIHISHDDKDTYSKAREKAEAAVRALRSGSNGFKSDFGIATGDIAHGEKRERLVKDNEAAASVLRQLGFPVMVTPGNHEIMQGEGNDALEAGYLKAFGAGTTTYGVLHHGVLFVMINSAGGMAGGTRVADRRNTKVAALLAQFPDTPKIIAFHIPVVPFRDEKILEASFGFSTYNLIGEGGLLSIIERYRDTVIAVLSGHLHLSGHVVVNGINYVSVSGTASYPNHYGEYTLYADRLHVRMRRIDSPFTQPFNSSVHNRKGIHYTDSLHRTYDAYVSGLLEEQEFDIPLTVAKRPKSQSGRFVLNDQGFVAPYSGIIAPELREEMWEPGLGPASVATPMQPPSIQPAPAPTTPPAITPAPAPVHAVVEKPAELPPTRVELTTTAGSVIATPPPTSSGRIVPVALGQRVWADRVYTVTRLPAELIGLEQRLKRCREHSVTILLRSPGRVYATFLPFNGVVPTRVELLAQGWILYREMAFNGEPYPAQHTIPGGGYDIYYRNVDAGETVLSEPRSAAACAWAIIGITN